MTARSWRATLKQRQSGVDPGRRWRWQMAVFMDIRSGLVWVATQQLESHKADLAIDMGRSLRCDVY
jgi:hypothetical protein